MALPSGDQLKLWLLETTWPIVKSSFVRSRASRLPLLSRAIGMIHSRVNLKFSSTALASFFALFAFSSASLGGSGIRNAMCSPVGDHLNWPTPVFTSVSCCASPPSIGSSQMLRLPLRLEANAITRPSADHCGFELDL